MSFFSPDLEAELDRPADLVQAPCHSTQNNPTPSKIQQYQMLFSYSHSQAIEILEQRSSNLNRSSISNAIWEEMREAQEANGFDKDAYEHLLERQLSSQPIRAPLVHFITAQSSGSATYLLKLDGEVSSPEALQSLLALPSSLAVSHDDDDPSVRFCRISAQDRIALLSKLSFRPTLIHLTQSAPKDFDANSKHPTLGTDATMPQCRLSSD